MSFTYVLIPADPNLEIKEMIGDGSGGLEHCKFTESCRQYFSQDVKVPETPEEKQALAEVMRKHCVDAGMPAEQLNKLTDEMLVSYGTSQTNNCEITALTLPIVKSEHRAVSCYSDRNAVQKELPLNQRVTAIAVSCGHTQSEIRGDAFLSRYHDDENKDIWRRVDFTADEAHGDAAWCLAARRKGGGGGSGGSGSSLGGLMQSFAQKDQGASNPVEEKTTDGKQGYTWTQDGDDVDVLLYVPGDTTARAVEVAFGMNSLTVSVGGVQLIQGTTGGSVCVDDSTWTLQGSGADRQVCVTLSKLRAGTQWAALLQ